MTSLRALAIATMAALVACARDHAPASAEERVRAPDACDDLTARWTSTLAKAGGACSNATECACFNGGVEKSHGCGGVTDRATAAALEALRSELERAKCRSGINCAAWACAPKCIAGRCSN